MAKRESKKQVSPSLGDPRRRHAAKPKETPPIFDARDWVQLTDAFVQVMSCVGRRDLAEIDINRDLRNGRLGSMKRSPDGTPTRLDPSIWQQWTVKAPMHPQEGVRVEPYVDGHVYVRRADLDRLYPRAGTPAPTPAPQAEDAQPPRPRRRKAGPKITKNWRIHVAGEISRIYENEKRIPRAAELAQFCGNKLGYYPDETTIQKMLRFLLDD
jgi:hypothetical protein